MCGICGITLFNKSRPIYRDILSMNNAISHRGPDDEGYAFVTSDFKPLFFSGASSPDEIRQSLPSIQEAGGFSARAALGHRRFSIIDPTASAHQPWYDREGQTLLAFNGEIYNYLELRDRLLKEGHGPFVSDSDTEVLSVAYRAWGNDCFNRFNGFWALAIIDLSKRNLILSRDRFGKKPLYLYRPDSGSLIFSSEIRSIMDSQQGGRASFSVDQEAALLYLLYDRRNTLKGSMWKEIELLDPATTRIVNMDTGQSSDFKYWQFPEKRLSESELSFDQSVDEFSSIFDHAVRLRLRSDVPLAANLSGGMDSSAIVASAQKFLGKDNPLETNIIRYKDAPEYDENKYASDVAQYVGSRHQEIFISSGETWSQLDHLIEAFEEPVHSLAFMTQWIGWKAIRESGIKVILHGAAADEMLAGYSYLTDIDDYQAFNKLNLPRYFSARSPWAIKPHLRTLKNMAGGFVLPSISNPLRRLAGLPDRRYHNRNYQPEVFQRWFSPSLLESNQEIHERFDKFFVDASKSLPNRMTADFTTLRIPFWVNAMDKSMMSLPVEVRMPFLDHQVVEYLFSLPVSYIYSGGWTKYILRKAMVGKLPESIVWRKQKMGFTVPKKKWLGRHRSEIKDIVASSRSRLQGFVQIDNLLNNIDEVPVDILWRCVNFAKWLEIFKPKV